MNFRKFFPLIAILFLSNCYLGGEYGDYEGAYNIVGTSPEELPFRKPPTRSNGEVPNYYYRYGPTVPASPEYAQQQYQYQYSPQGYAPTPYAPPAPAPAAAGQQYYRAAPPAGSRFYSNPYDIPQSPQGNPYDADQYYVPPSYYYNQEQQQYR